MRSMWFSAPRTPISFASRARPTATALWRAHADVGVEDHVVFLDQFVDLPTLLEFIAMCDVYVTPYLNESQMTSGTLAYSFALGKAIVSTPYWHAEELLADGRGILVPFADSAAIGSEIAGLLTDHPRRQAMRARAYSGGRSMIWERTAERYLTAFESARRGHRLRVIARLDQSTLPHATINVAPEMRTEYLLSMCDDTGLFQHAVHSVPDRAHGYCVDDNARALLLACCAQRPRRAAPARGLDGPVRVFRPGCLEPGYQAVSQLHELRSTLAGRSRFRGQPRADALGLGRVRAQRCERVAAALGHRFVRRSVAGGGELHLAARMGLHAARAGRLLRRDRRGFRPPSVCGSSSPPNWCPSCRSPRRGLGLVRGRAFLRQRASVPGADRHGTCDRDADLCRRGLAIPALADDGCRRRRQACSGRSVRTDSASSASRRSRSISNRWKPRRRSRPALRHCAPTAIPRGEPTRRVHSPGSSAAMISLCRWSTSRPGAAATGCIPTAQMRTAAANLWYPICSASRKSVSSRLRAATARGVRRSTSCVLELSRNPHSNEPRTLCHKSHS